MNALKEAMLKAKLVSPDVVEFTDRLESQRRQTLEAEQASRIGAKSNQSISLDRLSHVGNTPEFKDVAKKLLLEHPDLIGEVINQAHRFQELPGGKKLIWLMYQVKKGLEATANKEDREHFLKRALRKAGGTVEPTKEEWASVRQKRT